MSNYALFLLGSGILIGLYIGNVKLRMKFNSTVRKWGENINKNRIKKAIIK